MRISAWIALMVCLAAFNLNGCMGGVWTGASLVYDRHNVYKKVNDYHILANVTKALYPDKKFKTNGCALDITVFNGDVLVAGHVPNEYLLQEIKVRLQSVQGYRRMFNKVGLQQRSGNTLQDSWITAKIRSQIFADDSIDPKAFKIITADTVVYIMGDVQLKQAEKVINITRRTTGVSRVVKMLKYYTFEKDANTTN